MATWSIRAPICFCLFLCLCLLAFSVPATAHEPDGPIIFSTEGAVAPPQDRLTAFQPGEQLLRLSLQAVHPISDAVLIHTAPPGLSQRLLAVDATATERQLNPSEGAALTRIPLGNLEPGQPVFLDFAESHAQGSGGIVNFTIEGTGEGGRPVKAAYCFVVGTVGAQGVVRNGALEFPAHQLPEAKP